MEVDLTGIDKVVNHIKLTGLTKFTIERLGTNKGTIPVYELLNSNTNDKAVNTFINWAENVNGTMPYKLTLFDKIETSIDEQGNEKRTKSKNKAETSQILFRVNNTEFANGSGYLNTQYNVNGLVDRQSIRNEVLGEIQREQEEQTLKAQISALSAKVDALLNGDEDEDEEESIEANNLLSAQNLGNIMNLITGIKNMTNNSAQINGVETASVDTQAEFKTNINKAIKILYKNNPNVDKDLLKLADLSEKQPATFNMLLNSLRQM